MLLQIEIWLVGVNIFYYVFDLYLKLVAIDAATFNLYFNSIGINSWLRQSNERVRML